MSSQTDDEVIIEAADFSLLNKIGKGNLDKVLSHEAIKSAEKTIANAAGDFYTECVADANKLQQSIQQIKKGDTADVLKNVVAASFAVKTNAGQAGFSLVAELAKSLHVLCEESAHASLTPSWITIIAWHGTSIHHLLTSKIQGDGGDIGKAILAELAKLNAHKEQITKG